MIYNPKEGLKEEGDFGRIWNGESASAYGAVSPDPRIEISVIG